ncbi:hypothetical protein RISK_002086 [Rhodopirellula islandica]|uniref:Uncharacterized protein n=1 Tax=Rhodopirellula islandica TaxID=595434 RepID=A0A0J1EIX5_RHOIS|nr:hypothetical protein RISK_002086 [Rhodopirellula islandica]
MANGQVQSKTCGLMLAVGQQNRPQKRNFKTRDDRRIVPPTIRYTVLSGALISHATWS